MSIDLILGSSTYRPHAGLGMSFLFLTIIIAFIISLENWVVLFALLAPIILIPMFSVTISVLAFSITLFIGLYLLEEPFAVRPVDVLILVTMFSYISQKINNADYVLPDDKLKTPIIFLLGMLSISLVDSAAIGSGFLNLLKHVELFVLYFILVDIFRNFSLQKVRRFLDFFLYLNIIASIIAILILAYGTELRAFGITGVPLADLIVSALIISLSFLIFSSGSKSWMKYSIISLILLLELVLTQTRGAWLSFSISFLFLGVLIRNKSIPGTILKYLWIVFIVLLALLITITMFQNILLGITHKVEQLKYVDIGTIQFRLILWEAAIRAFLAHPINGIGLGQFAIFSVDYSSLGKSSIFKENLEGLTAHNVVLSYLSETGLIGLLGILIFYYSFMKLAYCSFKRAEDSSEMEIIIPLFTILFFVLISSVYAGEWFWGLNGAQFILFLALTSAVSNRV